MVVLALATAAITGSVGVLSERYGWNLPNYRNLNNPLSPDANVEVNAYNRAREILKSEEGYRTTAYLDSLGKLTVGIGHRVLPSDNIKLGQTITDARVQELFAADSVRAFQAAVKQAKELGKYNVEMIARLTSVNFQLGTGWTSIFPNTWSLIKSGKIAQAVKNLNTPKYEKGVPVNWAAQTPNRVAAFVSTLQSQFA